MEERFKKEGIKIERIKEEEEKRINEEEKNEKEERIKIKILSFPKTVKSIIDDIKKWKEEERRRAATRMIPDNLWFLKFLEYSSPFITFVKVKKR